MEGISYVYKGLRKIQLITGFGIIIAVDVGDLMNCSSNALVVMTGEGWFHVYLCLKSNKL